MKLKLRFRAKDGNKGLGCKLCRNANHGTGDFADGLVACKFDGGLRMYTECDQPVTFSDGDEYYLFEEYNGKNCTWFTNEDLEVTR